MSDHILDEIKRYKNLLESSVNMDPTNALSDRELVRFQQMPAAKQKIASPQQQAMLDREMNSRLNMDEKLSSNDRRRMLTRVMKRLEKLSGLKQDGQDLTEKMANFIINCITRGMSFEDALHLSNKQIAETNRHAADDKGPVAAHQNSTKTCDVCQGTGQDDYHKDHPCGACGGTGKESYMHEEMTKEGNAFLNARRNAAMKGLDSFEFDGKTHTITGDEDLGEGAYTNQFEDPKPAADHNDRNWKDWGTTKQDYTDAETKTWDSYMQNEDQNSTKTCDVCQGTGQDDYHKDHPCGACGGTGKESDMQNEDQNSTKKCDVCQGTGQDDYHKDHPCGACGGTGKESDTAAVDLHETKVFVNRLRKLSGLK